MRGRWKHRVHQPTANHDDAPPVLRYAVISGIKHIPAAAVSQPLKIREQLIETIPPPSIHQARNVLEGDVPRPQLGDHARVLPGESVPYAVHGGLLRAAAQNSEALAWRASEQQRQLADPDTGPLQELTACDLANVFAQRLDSDVRGVSGSSVTIDLNRTDDLKACLLETDRPSATSGEDVGYRDPPGHGMLRFPG